MLEIRAGTGGDEASIWAWRFGLMYLRQRQPKLKVKLVSESLLR